MHGYVSYSPETASKYSLVITNQRDSLIMYEGSDSFGECHSETLVSLHPASPCGRHKSELRQDFQSSVFLLPYLHLLSLPVIQNPFQSRAAALTSLPRAISCLLLEPCWLYRDTGDARVLHHCEKLQLSLVNFFFFFMKWCLHGWVQMSARPEHTSDNKIGILLGKYLHCLHPSVLSYELHVILRFSNVICVTDFQT